ncbi:MAG: GMC family oxidoreductase N-terminal domain-containing protein [Rhodospirillaceae bacterium]|nr:GMC family oxidoreductase N-terminal domain-containing protein [Rhodospirillaceae bacterium]
MNTADYIIVGAGSAGCALAYRLSENPNNTITLLEAGPADWSPYIHVPAAIIKAVGNPSLDWCHLAEPDPSRNGRVDLWPAGKVLGGSSSINGMLFVRGQAADYDGWAALGHGGWAFADVLPYFKRMESFADGDAAIRGRDGPLSVSHLRSRHLMGDIFVAAAQQAGIPFNPDYNGASQEGVSFPQVTQKRGWRHSASRAYLWRARGRPNLRIITGARAQRLVFDGKTCVGVEVVHNGRAVQHRANREVIVSSGSLGSPKLLMLSGIGPGADLQRLGVPVLVDNAQVGANMLEHPQGMVSIDVNVRTYNVDVNSPRILWYLARWLVMGDGPAASPYPHAVAFFKSTPDQPKPDVQVMLGPFAFDFTPQGIVPYRKPAVTAAFNVTLPNNPGRLSLRSADPNAPPIIAHSLYASADDLRTTVTAARVIRKIFRSDAFKPYLVRERLPGPEVESDTEWEEYLRRTSFLGYHPVGTCRMGAEEGGVVSSSLKVHGVERLRVADASIMPTLVSGNTNAAAIMIGERAADLILGA